MITIKTFGKIALTIGLFAAGYITHWYVSNNGSSTIPSNPTNTASVYIKQTPKNIYALSKDPTNCCVDTLATAPTKYFRKGSTPCPPDSSEYWKNMYKSLLPTNNSGTTTIIPGGDDCRPITN